MDNEIKKSLMLSGPQTLAFSNEGGFWKTRYSFHPTCYGAINSEMISSIATPNRNLFWLHNIGKINTFYGKTTDSSISVSFNDNVSVNKMFKSYSIEGSYNINGMSALYVNGTTDLNQLRESDFGPLKKIGGINYGFLSPSGINDGVLSPVAIINRAYDPGVETESSINSGDGVFLSVTQIGNNFWSSDQGAIVFGFTQEDGSVMIIPAFPFGNDPFDATESPYFDMDQDEVSSYDSLNDVPVSITANADLFQYYSNQVGSIGYMVTVQSEFEPSVAAISSVGLHGSFLSRINNYIDEFPDRPIIMYQIISGASISGTPKGQYADAVIMLGSDNFEVYAVNANYEPYDLDHRENQ